MAFSLRKNAPRTGVVYDAEAVPERMAPADLDRALTEGRGRSKAQRRDELARRHDEATHRRNLADLGVQTRIEDLARQERVAEALSAARIARTYREATAAGERTRIESQMRTSGEARSLTLERLRSLNIKALVPVLCAFGAWSTTGVQAGAAHLMHLTASSPMWWVLWLLEPALLGAVVWIIIARARLASAGGKLARQAEAIGGGCLATSIALNVVAGQATGGGVFAHVVGPVGAAMTAYLLGVVDTSITKADPWTLQDGGRAPSLADMDLAPPRITLDGIAPTAESAPDSSTPEDASEADDVAEAADDENASEPDDSDARRTTSEQDDDARSEARRRTRPNKGHKVPPSARPSASETSTRALPDEALMVRLVARIGAGELPRNPSIRAVQDALGLGFARAKRVMEMAELPTGGEDQEQDEAAA